MAADVDLCAYAVAMPPGWYFEASWLDRGELTIDRSACSLVPRGSRLVRLLFA